MGFKYGYLSESSQAKVSFGPLVCSGTLETADGGTSCASIKSEIFLMYVRSH